MPHDGFDNVAGATVVQTVSVSRADRRQSASPQRCGAAPTRADVILHVELVLDVVAVRPNLLVGITRQTRVAVGGKRCRHLKAR